MHLSQVDIQRVRNLNSITLYPAAGLNLVYGSNASGKTSLLEAIYLLSHGRSFRTSNIRSVIQHNSDQLQVFGKVKQQNTSTHVNLGIERSATYTQIRINHDSVNQASRLAAYLPVQVINPEAHRLLEQGPSQRRKYLDWGLFHVEPSFHETWQTYNRILKQRNAALRAKQAAKYVKIWDKPLLEEANKLTMMRESYVGQLLSYIQNFTDRLIHIVPDIQYRQGWAQDSDLEGVMTRALDRDYHQGYTRNGPHRADLQITVTGIPVQEQFSRGQQKLLVCAMRLAQIRHLKDCQDHSSVVLVDDIAAELDLSHRNSLLDLLVETQAQLFITVTEANLIDTGAWVSRKMFHVEHGQIAEVV